jgi:DNA adenine methylase Dam
MSVQIGFLFYSLIAHSFNHQIRYSNNGKFNMPFGKNRSCYNKALQKRVVEFVDKIDDSYLFSCLDFRDFYDCHKNCVKEKDFVYVDPPYLITTATYNENNGWTIKDEKDLLSLLDKLNNKNIKFGLSNVIRQNDKENTILANWAKNYNVHYLEYNYSNSSYHKKDRSTTDTQEVFICNY